MPPVFFVELKNSQGEYEPQGIMPLRAAMKLQFETGRAVSIQCVSPKKGVKHGQGNQDRQAV